MAETTTVSTEAVWTFRDLVSAPLAKVTSAFTLAGKASTAASNKITGMAKNMATSTLGVLGLGVGFGALAHKAYGANMELEKVKKSLTGALYGLQNWSAAATPVDKMTVSLKQAEGVINELEEAEERLAMPLEELAGAYKRLAAPAFQKLGMSQAQVLNLTKQTSAAAKVYGISAEQAAGTVGRALLTKTVRGADAFSMSLKASLGNMKKLSAPEIHRKIQAELEKAGPAAAKMSEGMEGTMFRLKDFIEDTLRDVAKPTFMAIAKVTEQWRKSLTSVVGEGKNAATVFGEKLGAAFVKIADFAGTILKYWKEIAAVIASVKIGGMLGGVGGAMSAAGGAGGMLGPLMGKFGALASSLGPVVAGLGAFAAGLSAAAQALDEYQTENINLKGEAEGMRSAFSQLHKAEVARTYLAKNSGLAEADKIGILAEQNQAAKIAYKIAKSYNLANAEGVVNVGQLQKRLSTLSSEELTTFANDLGMVGVKSAGLLATGFAEMMKKYGVKAEELPKGPDAGLDLLAKGKTNKKGDVIQNFNGDIKITQDFKDQDPDRVIVRFKDDLEGLAENRTQSNLSTVFGQ